MAGRGEVVIKLIGDSSSLSRELGQAEGRLGRFASSVSNLARAATVALAGAGVAAGAFAVSAVRSASNLEETVSKVNTIFGDSAAAIHEWAAGAAESFGMSRNQALTAAGDFGNLFVQLGLGVDHAGRLSTSMTELAADFASFHNADSVEVMTAMQAAFRGEYDALQRFVPTINAAAVQQRALEMTGKASTDMLTEQEKALATHALMMEGAGDAMGDFDRTSDSLANRQRILSARFEDVKAKIGQALMPVAIRLAEIVGDHLLPAFERAGEVLASFINTLRTGLTEDEGTPIERLALRIRELWQTAQPFINWLRANWQPVLAAAAVAVGLVVAPVATVIGALVAAYFRFEEFRNVVDAVARFLRDVVAPAVAAFARDVADQFGNLAGWVSRHWEAIREAVSHVVAVVEAVVRTFVAGVQAAWRAFGDELLTVASAVWSSIKTVIETAVGVVRGVIETALALINGDWGEAWEAVKRTLATVWEGIKTLVSDYLSILRAVLSGGLQAIGGAFGLAWDGIKSAARGAMDFIFGQVEQLPGRLLGIVERVAAAAAGIGRAILSGIGDALGAAWDVASNIVGDIAAGLRRAINGILSTVEGWINSGLDAADRAAGPWINFSEISLPRFHGGGVFQAVGREEGLAVLRDGEGVFTPEQMEALGGVRGPGVHIEHFHAGDQATPGDVARAWAWLTRTGGVSA